MAFNTEHTPPKPSRYCHKCGIYWPNHQGWTTCQLCDSPTQSDEHESGFSGPTEAWEYVLAEQERRRKQKVYDEFDADADAAALERDLARMLLTTEVDLAAQFATIQGLPNKEVTRDR